MANLKIHPTAIVASGAKLGADVEIGPYAVVEDDVEIGSGSVIGPHAVIHGHTRIGLISSTQSAQQYEARLQGFQDTY